MNTKDSDNIEKCVNLLEKISAQLTAAGYVVRDE